MGPPLSSWLAVPLTTVSGGDVPKATRTVHTGRGGAPRPRGQITLGRAPEPGRPSVHALGISGQVTMREWVRHLFQTGGAMYQPVFMEGSGLQAQWSTSRKHSQPPQRILEGCFIIIQPIGYLAP